MGNIRVDLRPISFDASDDQKDKHFKAMWAAFKRRTNDSGILLEYNRKQIFESDGEKRRRKQKESRVRKQQELNPRLRDHFGVKSDKPSSRNNRRVSEDF